ncbi:MAG: hypothetical protein IIB38_10030 [Candidatus Hydrogenedentes bacterium]|nr:hypothetical protein [Candidatus Hydrogenedentota bacterium]
MVLASKSGGYGALLFTDASANQYAGAVLELLEQALERMLYRTNTVDAIDVALVGGSDDAAWRLKKWRTAIRKTFPDVNEYDTGGNFHRKIHFHPETGLLHVEREESDPASWNPSSATLCAEDGKRVFSGGRSGGVVANATRFFREKQALAALREVVVPEHLRLSPDMPLKLWSACCSNGAEAYSCAMYAHYTLTQLSGRCQFGVFGTDINEPLLEIARNGEYALDKDQVAEWGPLFERYGEVEDLRIRFRDQIKSFVTFRPFDIKGQARRHRFRFIMCANVFQYYEDTAREHFLKNFVAVMERPGYIYANPIGDNIVQRLGLTRLPQYGLLKVS